MKPSENPDSSVFTNSASKFQTEPMHDFSETFIQHYSGIIIIVNIPENLIHFTNKVVNTVLGFEENDLSTSGHQLQQLVCEEDWNLMRIELEKLYTDPIASTTFICRLNVKNGNGKYFKISGSSFERKAATGPIRSVLLLGDDISETVAVKKELSDTRNLILETESFLNYGIYNWDYSTNSTKWSKGMYRIFNIPYDENNAQTVEWFMDFVDEEDQQKVQLAVDESIQFNKHYEVEYTIHPKNAPPKIVLSRGKVHFDDKGNLRILGITCDITELKDLDREHERMIHDLYRSNLELEEFAYVASHDLHEPLRKISTFSERLQSRFKTELPAEAEVYLKRIIASTGNMRMLIDSLLEFSRVSRYQPERKEIDLNQILNEVKSELELAIEESGAKITYSNLPSIEGGHSHIKRLFSNLIANAIKFRRPGINPEIEISFNKLKKASLEKLNLQSDRVFYNIQVHDNGIGFDEEYSQKIFQIFQRLHGKSEYPGSGMGLAICKKIVENHGGVMHAEGSSNGATFFINLPEKQ